MKKVIGYSEECFLAFSVVIYPGAEKCRLSQGTEFGDMALCRPVYVYIYTEFVRLSLLLSSSSGLFSMPDFIIKPRCMRMWNDLFHLLEGMDI